MDFDEYDYLEKTVEFAHLVKGSNGLGTTSRGAERRRIGKDRDEAEDGYRGKCHRSGDGERERVDRFADDWDCGHVEKSRDGERLERSLRDGGGRGFWDVEKDRRDGERRRHCEESNRMRDLERDHGFFCSYAQEKREKKEEAAAEQEADPERDQRLLVAFQAFEASLAEDLIDDFQLPITHRPTENLDTDNMEQASEDTQLTSSNVGFRLLQKMGWKGKGLGKDEQGMVEPIRAKSRDAKLGLGKQEQDDFYTAEENVHRKKLEVELEETEELMKRREVEAEREQKIQSEVKEIRKVFFCELCNKQYKLAMEFETHLSSYDHNHKKRFKEMREQQTSKGRDDRQKREQLRHEKELQRFAQLVEAQRQQQQPPAAPPPSRPELEVGNATTSLPTQDQRSAFKFGFASKPVASKMSMGGAAKKSKLVAKVAAVFQEESDGET